MTPDFLSCVDRVNLQCQAGSNDGQLIPHRYRVGAVRDFLKLRLRVKTAFLRRCAVVGCGFDSRQSLLICAQRSKRSQGTAEAQPEARDSVICPALPIVNCARQ